MGKIIVVLLGFTLIFLFVIEIIILWYVIFEFINFLSQKWFGVELKKELKEFIDRKRMRK